MNDLSYDRFFTTLGNENRLRIVRLLSKKGPRNVTDIARGTKLEQSAVSHNLKPLLACHFVHISQNGKQRVYSVNHQTIKPLITLIDRHVDKFCRKVCGRCWEGYAKTAIETR